ncbi:hypothetical protein [Paenibacillus bouchesdurhonensis]|uniref:hypothetical protein n=1 Tax=Paenibacillus bouchesdurhonensis TaxID=1870990 RepID=UPI000F971444|nr:hypothetical protein [Paenibacillus bouchesdurhonensis]
MKRNSVKTFFNTNIGDLEKEINDWLYENRRFTVQSIQYSAEGNHFSALVWYLV